MSGVVAMQEGSDGFVELTFLDEEGEQLAANALTALSWTLFDKESGEVINGRQGVVETVEGNPHRIHLAPADNEILDATRTREIHVIEWLAGYDSDLGEGLSLRGRVEFPVVNLTKTS